MFDGYLDFAGTEIINSSRAVAYAANVGLGVGCEDCPDLNEALGDSRYVDVAQDPAPWFDEAVPESRMFLGVVGMNVVGLDASTLTRTPIPLVGDGSAIGPARRAHREIAYTVALVARGECGLSYGMEWLSSALQGGACSSAVCDGDEMCMFACCPGEVPGQRIDPCFPGAGGGSPVPPDQIDGTSALRHLYDVALLDGPRVTEKRYLTGGFIWATVTFSLIAGKPWIYREPLRTLTEWVDLGTQPIIGPLDPDAVYEECEQYTPCLQDPDCELPPMPPRPPIPRDPCYPGGPDTFRQALIELDPMAPPEWAELVPVIEVSTGSTAMRRLIIRFWANPYNEPCQNLSDPCTACFDVSMNYLPAGALLTVDGRVERARVGCPQGDEGFVYTTPYLFGAQGRAFEWPVFTCPTGICVEVLSLASVTARNARIRVRMVPRSDAG